MSKDLIGKYCLVEMTPSKTEFHPEIRKITGLHTVYSNTHVILDDDNYSAYHIGGLLISDSKEQLENLLKVQNEYLEELNTLRNKIHDLKLQHSLNVSKMIKEIRG